MKLGILRNFEAPERKAIGISLSLVKSEGELEKMSAIDTPVSGPVISVFSLTQKATSCKQEKLCERCMIAQQLFAAILQIKLFRCSRKHVTLSAVGHSPC